MKKLNQERMFNFLANNGIKNFIGVPDSTLKHFIEQGLKKKKILIATREEEAIGIASGFANSLSTITSLVQLYQFPLIFLIGWRGYQKNDAPEHKKIGKIQPELIKSLGLKSRIIKDKNWKECCNWVIAESKNGHSCALIVPREFID